MTPIRTASIVGLTLLAAMSLAACSSPGGSTPSSAADSPAPAASASSVSAAPVAAASAAAPSTSGGAANAKPKACSLVSAAQFSSIVGRTVTALDKQAGQYDACAYENDSAAVGVMIVRPLSRADFEKSVAASPGKKEAVSGVGDEADSLTSDSTTGLAAWHDGLEVALTLNGSGGADSLTKAKAVATAAFASFTG